MPDPLVINAPARKLKVTVLLSPEGFAGLAIADHGMPPRTVLAIATEGRVYRADVATKGVRKAVRVISEVGAENAALVLQGVLAGKDGLTIVEAGLIAQVKTKAATEPEAETKAAA